MPNPFIEIKYDLERRLPRIEISFDPPLKEDGVWWMDVRLHGATAVVQWIPKISKFGVSEGTVTGFTHQPDEIYPDAASASERVIQILTTAGL
jgi:hypothetical protein